MVYPASLVLHRPQEDILQRIAPLLNTPDLYSKLRRGDIKVPRTQRVRHYQLDASARKARALTSKRAHLLRKRLGAAGHLHLDEVPMRAPLLFDIRDGCDA